MPQEHNIDIAILWWTSCIYSACALVDRQLAASQSNLEKFCPLSNELNESLRKKKARLTRQMHARALRMNRSTTLLVYSCPGLFRWRGEENEVRDRRASPRLNDVPAAVRRTHCCFSLPHISDPVFHVYCRSTWQRCDKIRWNLSQSRFYALFYCSSQ